VKIIEFVGSAFAVVTVAFFIVAVTFTFCVGLGVLLGFVALGFRLVAQ
jgi:hypothetical protein